MQCLKNKPQILRYLGIFVVHMSDKRLVFKLFLNTLKLNTRKVNLKHNDKRSECRFNQVRFTQGKHSWKERSSMI